MATAPAGFTIRLLPQAVSGGQRTAKLYHVALRNEDEAIEAVRRESGAGPDDVIEVIATMSDAEIRVLGLQVGEVRSV